MESPAFTLDGEHETPNGWLYTFTLSPGMSHHEMTLSWVDHEHLVGGSIAPEHVARAIFSLAIEFFDTQVPSKFDVSSLRRRFDRFEDVVRARIDAPL